MSQRMVELGRVDWYRTIAQVLDYEGVEGVSIVEQQYVGGVWEDSRAVYLDEEEQAALLNWMLGRRRDER